MALTDIDLANLETKPFFKSQVNNLMEILVFSYPDINVYFYVLDPHAGFVLQDLPTNQDHVFDSIRAEVPAIEALHTRETFTSEFILNQANAAIFSRDPSELSEYSLISPMGGQDGLAGFLLTIIPISLEREDLNLSLFDKIAESV
ncbi:MAG: hypothetical protein L3J79_01560, partial [Candidatus Marinimicrobia bacterium]|nr:hypothetical protein [Candidatus Neomarinimicrobiota bacterium]